MIDRRVCRPQNQSESSWVTAWSSALFGKLIVSQIMENFLEFVETAD
jgi:hypothetical protein